MKKRLSLLLVTLMVVAAAYWSLDYITGNHVEIHEVLPSNVEERELIFHWKTYFDGIQSYLTELINGDLGGISIQMTGYSDKFDILGSVLEKSWRSAMTLLPSLGIAVAVGVTMGALTFFLPRQIRNLLLVFNQILSSLPDLLLIALMQLLVIQINRWAGEVVIRIAELAEKPAYLLPILSIAIPLASYMYLYTVSACNEVLNREYIRTAKAKGLPNWFVFVKHVMRPAADSILSVIPKMAAIAASSLVIVERLSNIRGLTWYFNGRILQSNPILVAKLLATLLMCLAVFMIGIQLVTSLLRLWVNPALRK